MKKPIRFSAVFLLLLLVTALITTSVSAITETEIEAQVAAQGKDTVTGNVLIWFLCAVAFLKVSQKIDSFMASLGINVGHTGGSCSRTFCSQRAEYPPLPGLQDMHSAISAATVPVSVCPIGRV